MRLFPTLFVALFGLAGLAFQGSAFETLGVCAIDDQTVVCWSPEGAPRPEVAAEVKNRLETTGFPLSFIAGRKNRFIAVRSKPVAWVSYQSEGGGVQNYELGTEGTSPLALLRIAAPLGALSATVTVRLGALTNETVDVPFRKGAKASIGGVRIELGKSSEDSGEGLQGFPFNSGSAPFFSGRWRFPVEREADAGGFQFQALGRDNQPIEFVDEAGKPVAAAKGEAYWKDLRAPKHVWTGPPTILYAQLASDTNPYGGPSPLLWVGSNIDPWAIARLRVRRVVQQTEALGPFLLDPR